YFQKAYYVFYNEINFKKYDEYDEYIAENELRCFNGDVVKSREELEISNFLYLNQISYKYEAKYEYTTENEEYRQYQPDFYLPEYKIYIEHFGINRDGSTASFVDGKKYNEDIKWKRELHQKYKTELIETFSYEGREGCLTENLQKKLMTKGVYFNPISKENAVELFRENGTTNVFVKLVATFLNNYKASKETKNSLLEKANSAKNKNRTQAFLNIFFKIENAYEEYQRACGVIDFNDMVIVATKYIRSKKYISQYKYVLVDEFQDISFVRAQMVKELVSQNKNTLLCAVGDDWQSINRFAGSDISIVRNFEKFYGDNKTTYLDYTFRCNNIISDVSKRFIERNPEQIKKQIKTIKKSNQNSLFIWWDINEIEEGIKKILFEISKKRKNQNVSVFILARFWSVIPSGIEILNKLYKNITVTAMSVHASKGLEADYIIILGCNSGSTGFPSSRRHDSLIDLVLPEKEDFSYAEERRLFYVAMTRAKDAIYFFSTMYKKSVFIKELLNHEMEHITQINGSVSEEIACDKCYTGYLVKRRVKKSGKIFLACSNYPKCNNTKKIISCSQCGGYDFTKDKKKGIYKCSNSACAMEFPLCEKCESMMVKKEGKFGVFYGCSKYPKCTNTKK
ncbi:MAG: UvrD-helicase domain-containing protein, partial [Sulfurimonas sp.]